MYSDSPVYCTLTVKFTVMVQRTVHLWFYVQYWSSELYIYGTMYNGGPVYSTFMVQCTMMAQTTVHLLYSVQ
jgi:hypothetical protein